MRLLEILANGDFCLTKELLDDAIPQYAILSHTWGDESEEVTFEDMAKGAGRGKAGFEKIKFCGERAARDGLGYMWVDSCCIDKTSSAALSLAINSMFRWYQNAAKCYVYLSDVLACDVDLCSVPSRDSAFRRSRWFTRGWTLQELLAPTCVEFFSKEGAWFGDKKSLEQLLCNITGIPVMVFQGSPLNRLGVHERLLWAANRQTTIQEDRVYSLLGIFGVHIALIYGEGVENAAMRLGEAIGKRCSIQGTVLLLPPMPDGAAPKRPLSAYMRFANENRATVREEHPGIHFGQVGKLLGDKWRSFSDEEKKPYEDMAEADKKHYEGRGFANMVYAAARNSIRD